MIQDTKTFLPEETKYNNVKTETMIISTAAYSTTNGHFLVPFFLDITATTLQNIFYKLFTGFARTMLLTINID